eukprot:4253786-Prymnesium_polylepis.1
MHRRLRRCGTPRTHARPTHTHRPPSDVDVIPIAPTPTSAPRHPVVRRHMPSSSTGCMPLPALIPSPCDLQPACSHTALLCTATLASYSQNATASPTPPPTLLTQGKRKAIDEASPHSKKKKEEEEEAEAAEEHNVLFERLPDAGCDDDSGCQGVSPDQYDPKAHGNTGLGRRHISNRKER